MTMSRYCASPPRLDPPRGELDQAPARATPTSPPASSGSAASTSAPSPPAPPTGTRSCSGNDGQPNAYIDMGITAVNVAKKYEVSRADMDKYAQRSQELAVKSQEDGFFDREIVPVKTTDGNEVAKDDGPRASSTLEKLSELPEAFEGGGGVTAGNSCPLNDGAAAVAGHVRRARQGARPAAPRADRHRGHPRQRAGVHGRRPDRRDQDGARSRRDEDRRRRRGRAQRGLRRPGDPDHGRVRHPAREAEHPRRRDRARAIPSA